MKLPPDIEKYVRDVFDPSETDEAIEMLKNAKLHDGSKPGTRTLRCAIVASDKTLAGLRYQVKGLAIDYRDVILAAEYERKKGEWVQVRDLSKPFGK